MPLIDPHQVEQLASALSSLRSGKYSDFTIRCSNGTIILAHRAIICPRSQVLSAAIDGKFKESLLQEIFLEDDEPLIVANMIDFLYYLDYDDHRSDEVFRPQGSTESIPAVDDTTAETYIIGDKYDIRSLKEWAVTKYEEVLPATWNSTFFIESARLIFENTPESDVILRAVIIQRATENAKALFDHGEFVALLKSHGDFATEVLRRTLFHVPDDEPEEVEVDWAFGIAKKDKKKKFGRMY